MLHQNSRHTLALPLFLAFTFFINCPQSFAQTKIPPKTQEASPTEPSTEATNPQPEPKLTKEQQMPETSAKESSKYGLQISGGFPTGYGLGLNYQDASQMWGAGLEYSGFSVKQGTAPELKAALSQIKLHARYHPWAGSFYTGLYLGSQTTTIEGTDVYLGQRLTAKVEIKNNFVTPHIGWQWIYESGFMYGLELGAQVNTGAKIDFTDPTSEATILNDANYQADRKKVEDEGKKFGSSTIPHIVLFRFGYMF